MSISTDRNSIDLVPVPGTSGSDSCTRFCQLSFCKPFAPTEEAAVDYARAVVKYRFQTVPDKERERKTLPSEHGRRSPFHDQLQSLHRTSIDLRDVLTQPPIPKSKEHMKEGASKYAGVYFDKGANK